MFKVLYFGLIVSSQILGQNIPFKECYSGPIVWSNCDDPSQMKSPAVNQGAMIDQI